MTNWNELLEQAYKNHTPAPRRPKDKAKNVEPPKPYISLAMDTWDAVAVMFAEDHKNEIKYSPERGMWLLWSGYRWEWDTVGHIREIVKEQGRAYQAINSEDFRKWGKTLLSDKSITQLLNLAKTDPRLVVKLTDFDAEVYEINTPSGVVDLHTGELTPPTSSKLVKRATTVAPDASCPTPMYDRLMSETFAGDPDLSDYFETMVGVSLIKAQAEQVFLYMHGLPGSGKGTLMNLIQDLVGNGDSGYAAYVDSSMFVKSSQQAHPTELMQFLGARIAISSEISPGQKLDTGKLKKTTGGDKITGRYMGKDHVTFDATHTLWLMANDRLQVPHGDGGVWRRLREIPFEHAKQEGKRIANLDRILADEEGAGILAKWITKATEYLKHGYHTPQSVIDATAAYKAEQDTVAGWLEDCVESVPGKFTANGEIRASYVRWCRDEGQAPLSQKAVTQTLKRHGFMPTRTANTRGVSGIVVSSDTMGY